MNLINFILKEDNTRQLIGPISEIEVEIITIIFSNCEILVENTLSFYQILHEIQDSQRGSNPVINQPSFAFDQRTSTIPSVDDYSFRQTSYFTNDSDYSYRQSQTEDEIVDDFLRKSIVDTQTHVYEEFKEDKGKN